MSSHLATVKERFESKEKLVEAVQAFVNDDLWLPRLSSDRTRSNGESGSRGLGHVSNAKLLRLHGIFTEVKEQFKSRTKLIDAILELQARAKDADYKKRLDGYAVPRLYDLYKVEKRKAPKA